MSTPPQKNLKSYASVVSTTIPPQKKPMLPNAKKSYAQILSTCAATSSFFQSVERPLTCPELISLFSTFSPHQRTPIHMICSAIKQAKSSILLRIFHITTLSILKILHQQSTASVRVSIHYQYPPDLEKALHKTSIECRAWTKGPRYLMHKKTLLIDDDIVIVGSFNYTNASLVRDINMGIRIQNPELLSLIKSETSGYCTIGNQQVRYLSLSCRGKNQELSIVEEIQKARSSIQIAMYALSHSNILKALEEAVTKQNVFVSIILDGEFKNTFCDAIRTWKGRFSLFENTYPRCLHSKICCIDEKTLVCGSPNWSHCGFKNNMEDLLIITPLSPKQRQDFQSLWANLKTHSRQITQTLIDTPRIPRTEVPEDTVNMLRAHLQNFSP